MPSFLSTRRFWFTHSFVALLFVVIGYQLVQLTVIRRPSLTEAALRQHRLTVDIPPVRGAILDRTGKELATNLKVPSVYAVPRFIAKEDKGMFAEKAGEILKLDPSFVKERLARDKAFVWIKRRVRPEEAEEIRKFQHPGFGIIEEYKRFYPQGDLLAHILGFTDVDSRGLEGIELVLNQELKGRSGKRFTKRDARGQEIKAFEIKVIPPRNGHHVTLTIDQYLQYLTERALDRAFTQWKAKGGSAVLMEVDTGKILAIANRPGFDPNTSEKSKPETRRNRAITDMYEPGSVFKIVAASAALNENKVTPETTFDCENGEYHYGSHILHDVHPYGELNFSEVIVKSSNIGTVKIAALLAPDVFHHYIELFGFGKRTGIDLPGEAAGFIRPPSKWSKTSPYNIPMGQETMVTALQMTVAVSVIANGGNRVEPYIISRIEDGAGVILRDRKPSPAKPVLRPEVARTMREILTRAVEEGTGKKARIDGIPVGGKTGTGQKVLPNGRGYSHSNFMSSFVGFGPADKPKLAMAVVLDDPKPLYYGGTVAAPVFKEVMESALLASGHIPQNAERLGAAKIRSGPEPRQDVQENRPIMIPPKSAGRGF